MPDGPGGWGLPSKNGPTGTSTPSAGGGFSGVLQEFHVPWPACNQDAARQAADAWNTLADGIDGIVTDCNSAISSITSNNSGQAIDALAAHWQQYGGKAGSLPLTSAACRALAKACDDYADKVSDVKAQIEHKAEELVALTAAAAVALIFSFGVSAFVEASVAEGVVTWVTGLMEDLAANVAYTSTQLADDIGLLAAPVGAAAGAVFPAVAGGASAGTFAAMFDQEFQTTLDGLNHEPLPTAGEDTASLAKEVATGTMLGYLAEATPAVAEELTSAETASELLEVNPQLAAMLSQSSKLTAWLDTAAGKTFIQAGGIEALKKAGWLDETETEGQAIEKLLEGSLSKVDPSSNGAAE